MLLAPTPLFDLMLSLVCLYLGFRSLRGGHELLGIGYLMTCTAAFTGFFHLGGVMDFHWIHDFLSAVAEFIGTLCLGLGIIAVLWDWHRQRYAGYALCIFGPVVTYYFREIFRGPLPGLSLWAGVIFIVSVLTLAYQLWRAGRRGYALLSTGGILLTVFVGLFIHSVPHVPFLKPVDMLHISLLISYTAIYYSAMAYVRVGR